MPWSAWQDPIPLTLEWVVNAYTRTEFQLQWEPTSGRDENITVAPTTFFDNDREMIWNADWSDLSPGLSEGVNGLGWQFGLHPAWSTQRDWFPDLLGDLELGVDYAIRPDRDSDDPDRWVQYEDGPNVATATAMSTNPVFHFKVLNSGATYSPAPFRVGLRTNTSHTPGETGPWPGVGAVFGVGDAYLDAEENFNSAFPTTAVFPAAPGVESFTIGAELVDPGITLPHGTTALVVLRSPRPFLSFLTPPWRYWIPGDVLPLRQYPRNDGLRGGAPSAKATSRQATTARRTYL